MKLSRIHLLAACAASSFIASAAQASVVLPPVELRGAGATTVGDVAVRSLNCIGNPGNHVPGDIANNRANKYGTNSGQLLTIEPGLYNPTVPSATNPIHNCETQEVQPDFEGRYIGTGSGTGRQMWRTFTTSNLNGTAGNINPFTGGAGVPSGWTNLQFAFSEAPAAVSDITAYNAAANSATNGAGAAIQVPYYVVPIAFAYNPVYGIKTTVGGPVNLTFNVKTTYKQAINGVQAGGLRLSRAAYCKIFNGEITNWNDPLLSDLNGTFNSTDLALYDTANDSLARWNSEGAQIRLVGRADRSGGTDVFTRAMAAQCNGGQVTVNKYAKAAESLPFDNTSTIDIRTMRSDSRYFPTSATSNFSGTVQSLGGLVYDRLSDNVCKWNEVNPTTSQCDLTDPDVVGGVFNNAPTPGLFMVSDGSSGVAEAIETTVNNALITSTVDANIKLNGKLGYVGADFVKPVAGRNLHSASLQQGSAALAATTKYLMPSALNAGKAFGTVFAPQSIASSGAYSTLDTRTLGSVDPYLVINAGTNPATPVSRANPLHWAAVLYNPNVAINTTLAAPELGYAVTGTAFMLTSTCFKPANSAVPGNNASRFGIVEFMGVSFGKITKNSANTALSANTFKGTGTTALGILSQSNVALPSTGWVNAITDTFLKKTGTTAGTVGALNLWIQDNYPTTATDVDGLVQASDQKSNPGCDATKGA